MRMLILVCLFSLLSFSDPGSSTITETPSFEKISSVECSIKANHPRLDGLIQSLAYSFDEEVVGRQGCCSWHGGVCGCSSGRALCCDGSLSPSCGCVREGN